MSGQKLFLQLTPITAPVRKKSYCNLRVKRRTLIIDSFPEKKNKFWLTINSADCTVHNVYWEEHNNMDKNTGDYLQIIQ